MTTPTSTADLRADLVELEAEHNAPRSPIMPGRLRCDVGVRAVARTWLGTALSAVRAARQLVIQTATTEKPGCQIEVPVRI